MPEKQTDTNARKTSVPNAEKQVDPNAEKLVGHLLDSVKYNSLMNNRTSKNSIINLVALLFLVGMIIVGIFSYYAQRANSRSEVREQTQSVGAHISKEVEMAIKEYPAYEWLIKYWYENYEKVDIEYDADFNGGTLTEKKYATWVRRHPDIEFRYATEDELEKLDAVDKKLYAEIAYSWLITRLDQIKASYDVAFLFCVLPNSTFDSQFFLLSAADEGSVRGTSYEEVYPLGVSVQVGQDQTTAMKSALKDSSYLASAGDYMDYYAHIGEVDGRAVLIGITYDISALRENVNVRARRSTMLAMLQQFILASFCLWLIYRFVLKPLKIVQANIRQYTETKDSEAVADSLSKIRGRNEIKQLSDDVTVLAKEIDQYTDEIETITKERERIETELDLATRIQESSLPNVFPPFPDRHEFEIYASMNPAKEVGGDFYDFFFVDDDHLCLIMADISGKGIPAALFMMASKIMMEDNAAMGKSTAEILTDVNKGIVANNHEDMFVTAWLGILELSTGTLMASNAGHEFPVLMRKGESFELYKDKHNFVLGGMEGIKYKEYEIKLSPGDKIFLYTDGVPEATDANNELFGTDRMVEALNLVKDGSPEEILAGVDSAVNDFVKEAEQFDDLTMMCLVYNG